MTVFTPATTARTGPTTVCTVQLAGTELGEALQYIQNT